MEVLDDEKYSAYSGRRVYSEGLKTVDTRKKMETKDKEKLFLFNCLKNQFF